MEDVGRQWKLRLAKKEKVYIGETPYIDLRDKK